MSIAWRIAWTKASPVQRTSGSSRSSPPAENHQERSAKVNEGNEMANKLNEYRLRTARRHFLTRSAAGLGTAALASLLDPQLFAAEGTTISRGQVRPGVLGALHVPAKAKRVIYLVMSGGPSQID